MSEQTSQPRSPVAKWAPYIGMAVLLGLLIWSLTARRGPKEVIVARVNNHPITQRQLWRALERTDAGSWRRQMETMVAARLVQEELGSHNITMTDQEYSNLLQRADYYFRMLSGESQTLGQQTLDTLILGQLVRQEAQKRGITVSPEELEARIQQSADYTLARTGLNFEDWLKSTGQTKAEYEDHVSLRILTGKLVLPDKDRKKFFDANKARFAQLPHNNESVIYRQIVVAKKKEAEDIRKQLLSDDKADFAKIAKEKSLQPMTRDRGGMVGWAVKGKLNPPDPKLEKVLFSLKPGEISEPLPMNASGVTDDSKKPAFWRLVKVEKYFPPHELTMEDNADFIEQWMTSDPQFQSRLNEFYNNLRASASIEIPDARYKKLADAYKQLRDMREARDKASAMTLPQTGAGAESAPQPGGEKTGKTGKTKIQNEKSKQPAGGK